MPHQNQSNGLCEAVQLLADHDGFEGMANAVLILLNEAMKLELAVEFGPLDMNRESQSEFLSNGSIDRILLYRWHPDNQVVWATREPGCD